MTTSDNPLDAAKNRAHGLLEEAEADLAAGRISVAEWYARIDAVVTPAYLAGGNPRAQSGHSGDAERWRHARSLLVDGLVASGTFLDIGCANGHLMECLPVWAREEAGIELETHGLDFSAPLAALARSRLPASADRIHTGNAISWMPPCKYDIVRTGLEYVPRRSQRDLILHLLRHVVAPGGRLLIGVYNEERDASTVEQQIASWGFTIAGRAVRSHRDERLLYKVLWIDVPQTPMLQSRSRIVESVLRRASGSLGPSAPPAELVHSCPGLETLDDLPWGTPVWVRLDLDTPAVGPALQEDPRVAAATEILAAGRARGWRMLLLAHRGTTAAGSLRYVPEHLRQTLRGSAAFVVDWFDEAVCGFTARARSAFERVEPGGYALLENTRRYGFEMYLQRTAERGPPPAIDTFRRITAELRSAADVYVNDAFATCNENYTTAVLPLGMRRVALGPFARHELLAHATAVGAASLLCCSGAKWNKLEHLLGIVERGDVEVVLVGGSLAMALLPAAQDALPTGAHLHVAAQSRRTGQRVVAAAALRNVRLVLPVDFVLADGSVVERLPQGAWPQDIGPQTVATFQLEAQGWLARTSRPVLYANGVMGRFEDARWAAGTEAVVALLVQLQRSGASVYVGGGEGRAALERYASVRSVTHAFTAGGTLLRILGGRPLPFLEALAARAEHHQPLL